MKLSFLRSKWFWIAFIVIAGIGGWYVRSRQAATGPFYETTKVSRGDVVQTVEVTGELKPEARIDLAFKSGGTIASIPVSIGKKVKKGDVLAELQNRDVRFATDRAAATLAIARANLAARLAGETNAAIEIARASVKQAQASYDKATSDLEITRQTVEDEYRVAQIALDTARANAQNTGSTNQSSVQNATDSLRAALTTALGSVQTGLTDGDAILGIDNTAANDNYENYLSLSDHMILDAAHNQYLIAKPARVQAEAAVRGLTSTSTATTVRAAASLMKDALQKTLLYLDYTQRVLANTITGSNLSAAELSAKQSTINGDRSAVSAQYTTVQNAEQTLANSEQGYTTNDVQLQNAVKTAEANLTIADHNRTSKVKTAETNVAIQSAGLASAEAALELKVTPPRSVDVAALRAQVQDAETAYAQAAAKLSDVQIMAPADGIITDILPAAGEETAPNVVAIKMIATAGYTIEALVPEADIAKVQADQEVKITLDAYGEDVPFQGKVLAENPDQTKVQDAIYYKTIVTIDPAGKDVKPGMTANLTIKTGEKKGVLWVPTRAVRQRDGQRYVRVLVGKTPTETDIQVGLRGDEGRTEVASGVADGQIVVVSEVSADEFAKLGAEQKAGN